MEGVRPLVDPDEHGEVDTSRYPEPKAGGRPKGGMSGVSGVAEELRGLGGWACGPGALDPELLTVKTFYFFFYSAFGSLFPLMGVYFKQMGMNAGQCGLLIGTRPFVEFLSAPFWGGLADRWRRGRALLLGSLAAWILFTVPLGWVQPGAAACVRAVNGTAYRLVPPSYDADESPVAGGRFPGVGGEYARSSPLPVSDALNYDESLHGEWVTPLHSSIVYRTPDVKKTFFLLLLLVVIGEFFSAPAITLADSAVITLLGEDADRYYFEERSTRATRVRHRIRQVRSSTHVRVSRLGTGDVLRGHSAGPQHRVRAASLRRAAAVREELHHLLRDVLRADGCGVAHRHADTVQIRMAERTTSHARGGSPSVRGGEAAESARGAAATARPRHVSRAAAVAPSEGVRSDDPRDAGVDLRSPPVPQREGGVLPAGRVVHGFRHRAHLHLSVLASAGHRGRADALRSRLRHQSRVGDIRLLLQFRPHLATRSRARAVRRPRGQRVTFPVHRLADRPVVGAALRVRAGRHARGRVGRLLQLRGRGDPGGPSRIGAGRSAGAAPRTRARLRGGARRRVGRAVRGSRRVRRLRAPVRRGAGGVRGGQPARRGGRAARSAGDRSRAARSARRALGSSSARVVFFASE